MLTLDDATDAADRAARDERAGAAFGGLRTGSAALERRRGLRLRGYGYVPGVRVSGTITPRGARFTLSCGRAAAHGRLTFSRRAVTGALDGVRCTWGARWRGVVVRCRRGCLGGRVRGTLAVPRRYVCGARGRASASPLGLATVPTPPLLQRLLTTPGPSGYEGDAAAVWREAAAEFADVSTDALGSSVARVRGTADGPLLAIVGHIDEIGVHVSHIDDDGFLRFGSVGGWDPIILVGQRVTLVTRDGEIPGVIGKKPIHLMKDEDRKRVPELKDLHIDIGAGDGDDARSLVRIGDVAVIAGEPVELPNGRLVSRALDNRIGCYVALEAARLVAEAGGAAGDVAAVAAVQEEITFAGSRTTAFSLAPDLAVAVDVTFATDQPGVELGELTKHPLGSGPRSHAARRSIRACSSCCTRPPRPRGSPSRSHPPAAARARTLTRSISAALAFPLHWSPCHCATCTLRSSCASSTTWRTPRDCSRRSRCGWTGHFQGRERFRRSESAHA